MLNMLNNDKKYINTIIEYIKNISTGVIYNNNDNNSLINTNNEIFISELRDTYPNDKFEVKIKNDTRKIPYSWFSDFEQLYTIIIPPTVKTIDNLAFFNCGCLKNVFFENKEMSKLENIGNCAFDRCYNLYNFDFLPKIKNIGHHAFYASGLNSINLTNTELTKIDKFTFCGCKNVTDVIINNNITIIDDYAFCGCINLKNIRLNNLIKEIGRNTFCKCESLEYIKLPPKITLIDDCAFFDCLKLKRIIYSNKSFTTQNIEFLYDKPVYNINSNGDKINYGINVFTGIPDDVDIMPE